MNKHKATINLRIFTILILLSAVTNTLKPQKNEVFSSRIKMWNDVIEKNYVYMSAYVGHGSYSMNGLKKVHEQFLSLYGIEAMQNSNFPAYPLYGLSVSRKYDNSLFGLNMEYMSTGARSSLADYSAQFTSDFVCKGYKLGFFLEKDINYKFSKIEKLEFGYIIEAGSIVSKIQHDALLDYSNYNITDETLKMELSTTSPYIEPTILARWPLTETIFLQVNTSFFVDFPASFYLGEEIPETKISWLGYRLKLKITCRL